MFTKKLITSISVIASLLACAAGFWLFDGHYETTAAAVEKIELVELRVAATIQDQQKMLKLGILDNKLQILYNRKENLNKQYYNLSRELQKNPTDLFLQEEFKDVKQQLIEINKRINNALN